MYKYTVVFTDHLDQRWDHGIWVDKTSMTDEHIILTENRFQKTTSLHRVSPEERFVISELQKVRELPWNDRTEKLKSTIVTQQCKTHLDIDVCTWRLESYEDMLQRLIAVTVSTWDHIQKHIEYDWKRHWPMREQILSKRQLDQSLSLLPSPMNQYGRHSRSQRLHHPSSSMSTQNLQNEQMDSSMELGPQERRERKGARPNETPTSEISGRPVVKTRSASSPMIVSTVEDSGTVVLSTRASSSKDEMTIDGLYVIDWIDVVTTLVPEEDMW